MRKMVASFSWCVTMKSRKMVTAHSVHKIPRGMLSVNSNEKCIQEGKEDKSENKAEIETHLNKGT